MTAPKKLSGLQKQVVSLYRNCIRTAYTKPTENRHHFIDFTRKEFGKYKSLPKKEFGAIEHLLRLGNRRLEMLSQSEIKDIH
ncbi:Sdh6p SCDLUD_003242 [Saccharomycodes ludwigii]|nr:hypothetical protein SCDLUD_003242 [Saccharomycodes ludwigii]KAH3900270.1 hypothetical protein SCDLUD_003242 [Saccharomycodes ludwigii]